MTAGVSAKLEFDIRDALAGVDRLDAALTSVVQEWQTRMARALDNVSIPKQTVKVEADTAGMTSEVTGAVDAADTSVVVTGDATELTGDVTAAVDAADTSVTVTADTTAARDELGRFQAQGGQAADGIGKSFKGAFTAVAGAVAALGIGKFFADAVTGASDLAESQSKVNAVFGDSAGVVQAFAKTSATSVGLSEQAALEATGTFGNLFTALGTSREEAAKLAPEIVTLGADLASFNNLSVDEALIKLKSGLVGEIEPLRSIGISFTAVQVEAKAMELGLASADGQLSESAKLQARYALIVEQSKNAQGDFQKTSAGLANQQRILAAEVENLKGAAGAALLPVVLQLVSAFRELLPTVQPLITRVAELAGKVIATLLPALTGIIKGLLPIADAIVSVVEPSLELLGPVFEFVGVFAEAFGVSIGKIITWLNDLPAPLKAIIFPLGALGDVLRDLGVITPKVSQELKTASGETVKMASGTELLQTALEGTPEEFAKLQATATGFAAAGVSDELRKTGVTMEDLRKQLILGDAGLKQFAASGIKAGQVKFVDTATGAELTAERIAGLKGNLDQYLRSGQIAVTQGGMLVNTFQNEAQAIQAAAKQQLDATVTARGLTQAQVEALPGLAQATLGTSNYAAQLQVLNQGLANGTIQVQQQNATLATSAAAWLALAEGVANGTITEQNAIQVGQSLGLTQQQVTDAINATKGAIDAFVQAAVQQLPTAQSVMSQLAQSGVVDVGTYTQKINEATLASLNFGANIETIGQKYPEVAAELAKLGPQVGGSLASSFLASTDAQKQALNDTIANSEAANKQVGETYRKFASDNIQAATDLGSGLTKGFADGINLQGVTQEQIDGVTKKLQDDQAVGPAKDAAKVSGTAVGDSLAAGMAAGIFKGIPGVEQAARDLAKRASEAAKAELVVKSPSRVFADIGEQMGAGLVVGMADAQAQVVAEAEAIVAQAAAGAAQLVPAVAAVSAGSGTVGAPGGVNVDRLNLTLQFQGQQPTEDQARALGAAAVDGALSQLDARKVDVAARTV